MAMKKIEKEQIFALAEMGFKVRPVIPWEYSDPYIEDRYYMITVCDNSDHVIAEYQYMLDEHGMELFMAEMNEHLSKGGA